MGGGHGLRDLGMLLSVLVRLEATFENKDLYPDLYNKAAALMDSLVRNHPFVGGNKRTAITGATLFLMISGYRVVVENDELAQSTLACAQSQLSLIEIRDWFKKYCKSPEA